MSTVTSSCTPSALQSARQLKIPDREATLRRDPSVRRFWLQHRKLLEQAWQEWGETPEGKALPPLDSSLIHAPLRHAVEAAWEDPANNEENVRKLWQEVHPGVYQCQFFDTERLADLRAHFDAVGDIPTRPPYGIVLNRQGYMLDERSEGYFASPSFQAFYRDVLVDKYVRPLSFLLFGDYIQSADASESFGFTIQYTPSTDQGIRWHSDASAMTFNVNMDETKTWEGSSLIFADGTAGERKSEVNFEPGMAVMHRGAVPHTAVPITDGKRSNMVLWVMGKNGQHSMYPYQEMMTPEERWKVPVKDEDEKPDTWAPF